MINFIKGFLIGIAKIIPGVSGALLAINFGIYERIIYSITHFFDHKKDNIIFLIPILSGLLLSIILFSNIIIYLLNNYRFLTLSLFGNSFYK